MLEKGTDPFFEGRGVSDLGPGWLGLCFTSHQAPSSSLLFLVAHPLTRLRVAFFACPKKATKERAPEARAPSGFPPTALSLRDPSTGILPDDGLAGLPAGYPVPCGARAISRSGGRGRRGLRGRARCFVPDGRWFLPPGRSRTSCFKELGTGCEVGRSHLLVPSFSPLATSLPPLNAPRPGGKGVRPLFRNSGEEQGTWDESIRSPNHPGPKFLAPCSHQTRESEAS